jgi:hypothetical protein
LSYKAYVATDLPAYRQVEFQAPGGLGEVMLQIVVEPGSSPPWVGLFRSLGYSDVTQLFTWSDAPMVLAIARGFPHYFRADEPGMRTEVPVFPVHHAIRHPSGIVVLGGFDRFCGVDGASVAWVSERVASDWLVDVQLKGNHVHGRGNVPSTGGSEPFKIDVMTGSTSTMWREDL